MHILFVNSIRMWGGAEVWLMDSAGVGYDIGAVERYYRLFAPVIVK